MRDHKITNGKEKMKGNGGKWKMGDLVAAHHP